VDSSNIRQPAVAGTFYPDDPQILGSEVERLIKNAATTQSKGTLVALIVPHAGYQYSGLTASAGYKLLTNQTFETVVIVSPSHREYFDGISVFNGTAYRTPLGDVPIDEQLRAALINDETIIESSQRGHNDEHAIEVQLPFIQKVLKNTRLLPIVIGDQRREYCFHLGEKLGDILKRTKTLLVASTDLSHYHPYNEAEMLDKIIIDDVARFDEKQMMLDIEGQRAEACGGGPAVAVLAAARKLGANHVEILAHCNSGDTTGDHSHVVGYLSAAMYRTK
jgi:AmmeMemoRadiSam system protein B